MRSSVTGFAFPVIGGLSTVAAAGTLTGPGDHATIQAAVDAAGDGDTYTGNRAKKSGVFDFEDRGAQGASILTDNQFDLAKSVFDQ